MNNRTRYNYYTTILFNQGRDCCRHSIYLVNNKFWGEIQYIKLYWNIYIYTGCPSVVCWLNLSPHHANNQVEEDKTSTAAPAHGWNYTISQSVILDLLSAHRNNTTIRKSIFRYFQTSQEGSAWLLQNIKLIIKINWNDHEKIPLWN